MREALGPLGGEFVDISARQILAKIYAALLSGSTSLALVINATFYESLNSAYLMVVLTILLSVYVVSSPRLFFCREFALYAAFVCYLFILLLWTSDVLLALNTLFPAVDFLLILLLLGSLLRFQDLRSVLTGILVGFFMGAGAYTYVEGFPFVYPKNLSYNAVAGMYLFGLFFTLIFGWLTRSRLLPLLVTLILLVHLVATTSIKTNLGIMLGAAAGGLVYFKQSLEMLRRNAVYLVVLAGVIGYAIASNDSVVERVQVGLGRVAVGLEVLRAREDIAGYTGYGQRQYWMGLGLEGWSQNPVFGYGVEAFRSQFEITSHSTPIDLLYNSGIIGFGLFYGIFMSIVWRLLRARQVISGGIAALIFGALVCYLFISLSAIVHYNAFLAGFVAISTAFLIRYRECDCRSGTAPDEP